MIKKIMLVAVALAAVLCLPGCHSPAGGVFPFTGGSHTYFSYETRPLTLTIVDLRTSEDIFTMNVPPGKQLSFDFKDGEGDDPVYTPDLMRYEVFDMGTTDGKLRNTLNVPPANARRIDVSYRDDYEYRTADGAMKIRSDQLLNQPHRWQPGQGMPYPERVTSVPTRYDR